MNKTKIEWVRNKDGTQGYTWNPITGCLGPNGTPEKPDRCSYCFAHKLAKGRLKQRYLSIPEYPYDDYPALLVPKTNRSDPFVPRFWRHRLREPFWHRKPCTIFVCSMGELFNEYYPASWFGNVLQTFYGCPQHTFLVLTKNPRPAIHVALPPNVWLGATLNTFDDWGRGYFLRETSAKLKFFSFEPLLSNFFASSYSLPLDGIGWIIIGAQTNPYRPPKKEWVHRIVDEADRLGIPVFLKNNLKPLLGDNLRQELPHVR